MTHLHKYDRLLTYCQATANQLASCLIVVLSNSTLFSKHLVQ